MIDFVEKMFGLATGDAVRKIASDMKIDLSDHGPAEKGLNKRTPYVDKEKGIDKKTADEMTRDLEAYCLRVLVIYKEFLERRAFM